MILTFIICLMISGTMNDLPEPAGPLIKMILALVYGWRAALAAMQIASAWSLRKPQA
jgi:hypothetical protein